MIHLIFLILSIPTVSYSQTPRCIDLFSRWSLQEKRVAPWISSLPEIILRGKAAVREQKMTEGDKKIFQEIILLSQSQLDSLSNKELFDVYDVFARWNLVVPVEFNRRIFRAFSSKIDSWKEKDYLAFAVTSKFTPNPTSKTFQVLLKKNILQKFSGWKVNTQMNALAAELFQQRKYSFREIAFLLAETNRSLEKTSDVQRIQSLKELYRGLLYLRSIEASFNSHLRLQLEHQLERHMNSLGFSLTTDGTSGATNKITRKSNTRIYFEWRLDDIFGVKQKFEEYSDPVKLGFFDPVDLFYESQDLVVEWDGPHHYFQVLVLNAKGEIIGFKDNILRPLDQIKDIILRRQGYDILRISALLNSSLEYVDILGLIKNQNTIVPR